MNKANQTKALLGTEKIGFVMCTKIQSLRCHRDDLRIELENYENKPAVIALTETWLTENDDLENDYNMEKYQPIESKPRTSGQERGGVAFYIQEDIKYKVIEFQSAIECLIIQTNFDTKAIRNLCVIYRPHSHKTPRFLQEFEKLLEFLRRLKNDTILCGDFNIDTIKESKDKSEYEKLLLAFDFERQNFEPTRVTPTSATCLDHIVTSYQINTETIKTTISDHYAVLGAISGVIVKESKNRKMKQLSRDLRKIKGGNALKFLFLLDQTLKKLEQSKQKDIEKIAETIMLCVDKFAPVKESTVKKLSNDWIKNKLKNGITKRNKLFQNWLKCPTEKTAVFIKTKGT